MRTLQRPHTVSRGQTGSRYMETENKDRGQGGTTSMSSKSQDFIREKSWLAFLPASLGQKYDPQQVAHATWIYTYAQTSSTNWIQCFKKKKKRGYYQKTLYTCINLSKRRDIFLKRNSKEAGVPHMLGQQDGFISSSLLALIHPCCIRISKPAW